jgi:MFS transporter
VTRRTAAGCAPALLGALDFGFLVVAGPVLAADLELGSAYAWIFSAGSLAYGAVVMPAEALLARVTASRLLVAGLALAAAGTLLVATAGGIVPALTGRVLFGAGTGVAAAPALVLLTDEDAAFARMGGAIALGFSAGVVLGALGDWRASLALIAALAAAAAGAGARVAAPALAAGGAGGALRLGAATAGAAAFLAIVRAEPVVGGLVLLAVGALAASGWRAVRCRLPRPHGRLLVACAAGAATTMSGVGAMVLLGRELGETASPADELALALFGLATFGAVGSARRLSLSRGPLGAAAAGLAGQALAILVLASGSPLLVPSIALFGAAHVVANAGAAAAVMERAGERPATAAGLYATCQYLAAGAGALVVVSAGMVLAGVIALGGVAVAASQRRAIHSVSRLL